MSEPALAAPGTVAVVAPLELIEVPIDVLAKPTLPLILADTAFLTTLKTVESQVKSLKITDAQSAQQAADLLARLTTAGKKLNETRLALNRPFQAQQDRINELAKAPTARIDDLKQTLKVAQTNYANQVERERVAEEKRKAAELTRLEAIRAKEQADEEARLAEIERQAEEARQAAPTLPADVVVEEEWVEPPAPEPVEPTPTQKAIEAIRYAPAAVVAKPTGIAFKVTLVPTVTDVLQLPEHFVERIAKVGAIKSTFCVGWKEGAPMPVCPGVKFEVKREPVSTGKGAF